ncbi:MAG: hypothetical protein H0V01_11635 [Bacteroidetes bacterium]|nr:hypothetical protein [Bacteroidota bacterium]HET6245260.1 hypothetical protein [Bacteroidia bacterium]
MIFKTNKEMEDYLLQTGSGILNKTVDLPIELEKILKSDFTTNNDCIILQGTPNVHERINLISDGEKCALEFQENSIHPLDFIEHPRSELEYLTLAIECGKRLANRLTNEFKEKKFKIIVSFNETKKENEKIIQIGGSSVSFYQIRDKCKNKILFENKKEYVSEALLEINI